MPSQGLPDGGKLRSECEPLHRFLPRECRLCGCTEFRACAGGCSWVLLDINQPTGICSVCARGLDWDPVLMARVGLEEEGDHGT